MAEKRQVCRTKIFESIGRASMCWSPRPEGVFLSCEALQIANELIGFIEQNKENQKEIKAESIDIIEQSI